MRSKGFGVEIVCIETSEAHDVYFFKLSEMMRKLRIWKSLLAKPVRQHVDRGYFCLHHAPQEAINDDGFVVIESMSTLNMRS